MVVTWTSHVHADCFTRIILADAPTSALDVYDRIGFPGS